MIAFLVLETLMVGMFCALRFRPVLHLLRRRADPDVPDHRDLGKRQRLYAAFKFFLYTLTGSVLMLIAISRSISNGRPISQRFWKAALDPDMQIWLWLAFFASFAVKVPMWPGPHVASDAHVEARRRKLGHLAGVLLKMGAYGFLRFSVPMLPFATEFFRR